MYDINFMHVYKIHVATYRKGLLTWVTFSAIASLLICNFVISSPEPKAHKVSL